MKETGSYEDLGGCRSQIGHAEWLDRSKLSYGELPRMDALVLTYIWN